MTELSRPLVAAAHPRVTQSLERIRAEFQEMPDLCLTCERVARLCGLERAACECLLRALADTGYLERAADGRYARRADLHRARRTRE
jgi:DNA-binding IclR family transcriptional regulator